MFRRIWRALPFYRIYDFIRCSIEYSKINRTVGVVFHSDDMKLILKKYLKADFKEDWIGRIYGVVNPAINKDGEYDISSVIMELDDDKTNNENWVSAWIYRQLMMVSSLFKLDKLYDYINLEIEHVGPSNMDNFLLIFDLISRKNFVKSIKMLIINLIVWGGITLGILALNGVL